MRGLVWSVAVIGFVSSSFVPQHSSSSSLRCTSIGSSTTSAVTKMSPTVTVRLAEETDDLERVTGILNAAYQEGETGILVDTPENPLERATREEVLGFCRNQQLLVLLVDQLVMGCVKVEAPLPSQDDDGDDDDASAVVIGEWGCLALAKESQGKGYGRVLVKAAESHIFQKCAVCQLELLAPSKWKHQHKERLREWYLRMGYNLRIPNDYDASTMTLPQGSTLGQRFVLATDGDFTSYHKPRPSE